jgi:hypothetical protein
MTDKCEDILRKFIQQNYQKVARDTKNNEETKRAIEAEREMAIEQKIEDERRTRHLERQAQKRAKIIERRKRGHSVIETPLLKPLQPVDVPPVLDIPPATTETLPKLTNAQKRTISIAQMVDKIKNRQK